MCRMITPEFRVSHPHVFKAQAPKPTDRKKFSITMLFPKNVDLLGQTCDGKPIKLQDIIRNAKLVHYGPKENWPEDLESPVNDGDGKAGIDKKTGKRKEGYAGHWVIKATTNEDQRPGIVDENAVPITDQAKFYPGCYARAYIYARRWEYMGKEGVQFILDHVQKTRDGKSFGGKKPIDQVFGPVASEATGDTEGVEEESVDFS